MTQPTTPDQPATTAPAKPADTAAPDSGTAAPSGAATVRGGKPKTALALPKLAFTLPTVLGGIGVVFAILLIASIWAGPFVLVTGTFLLAIAAEIVLFAWRTLVKAAAGSPALWVSMAVGAGLFLFAGIYGWFNFDAVWAVYGAGRPSQNLGGITVFASCMAGLMSAVFGVILFRGRSKA